MWMPCADGGLPLDKSARGPFGFWQKGDSFRDALNGVLMRHGGDFQNPLFTADTVLRIERVKGHWNGTRHIHVWEREVSTLADCADLVNADAHTCDFMGDEQ